MIRHILFALLLLTTACHPADVVLGDIARLVWMGHGIDRVASWADQESVNILRPIAHYKMNDNAASTLVVDSSVRANHGTAATNTSIMASVGKINGALTFNGSTDCINLGNTLGFDSTNTFSVNFWVKHAGGYNMFIGKNEEALGHTKSGWAIFHVDDIVYVQLNAGTAYMQNEVQFNFYTPVSIQQGEWCMVTVTYDGSMKGEGIKVHVNGVATAGDTSCDTLTGSILNDKPAIIGGTYDKDLTKAFAGAMDDVRVYDKVLVRTEIDELYNSGVGTEDELTYNRPGPYKLKTDAWYKMDDNASDQRVVDSSSNANDANATTLTYMVATNGVLGGALEFVGHNIYATTPPINFGTRTDMTISFWTNKRANTNGIEFVINKDDVTNKREFLVAFNRAMGGIQSYFWMTDSVWTEAYFPFTPNGAWSHVVVMFKGANAEVVAYVNGVQVQDMYYVSRNATSVQGTDAIISIARRPWIENWEYFCDGALDDLRVYNKALSVEEVAELYNNGAGLATELTYLRPPGTDTQRLRPAAWYPLDDNTPSNTVVDTSVFHRAGASQATTSSKAVQGKLGGAMSFDGTNDYVTIGTHTLMRNQRVTVSAWVRPLEPLNPYNCVIFGCGNDYGSPSSFTLAYTTTDALVAPGEQFAYGWHPFLMTMSRNTDPAQAQHYLISPTYLERGVWYHLVGVVDTDKKDLYVNGALVASTSTFPTGFDPGNLNAIGIQTQRPGYSFQMHGDIDDLRVYDNALTQAEVTELYNAGAGTTKDLTYVRPADVVGSSSLITIAFDLSGVAGTAPANLTVAPGSPYDYGAFQDAYSSDPSYWFNGWRTADYQNWYYSWQSGTYPSANTTLYADWYYSPPYYYTTFDLNGQAGTLDWFSQGQYQAGYPFDWGSGFPIATANDPNYVFSCWKDAGGNVWESYYNAPYSDLTLYVEWTYIGP